MAFRNDNGRSFDRMDNTKAAMFNRSLTIHNPNSNPLLSQSEFSKKPRPLDRLGSLKKPYSSSFDSLVSAGNPLRGSVRKLCSLFEKPTQSSAGFQPPAASSPASPKPAKVVNSDCILTSVGSSPFRLPGTEDRVVIYFTSLRGIRKTYSDCYAVRMIFKGFRVNLDERDISMDSAYKKELQSILGEKVIVLPQVFIKGKYIGGADVVRQLNEAGELSKLLKGLPLQALKPGLGYICEGCGDVRFVPCSNCNGSRKVFEEDDEQLKRCPLCNENGLVRCPECCY